MGSQGLNDMSFTDKAKKIRDTKTPEELTNMYDEWARNSGYEKEVKAQGYTAPYVLASALACYLPNKKDARILDVGAGTGYVADQLKDLGFHNLDALDPSDGMLDSARAKNLYKKYLTAYFTDNVKELKTDCYDALISAGSMCHGHLKCNSLPEMIRAVRKGGLVVLVTRECDLYAQAEYKDRLEPFMKQLENQGLWTFCERRIFANYLPGVNGILFAFRITK